MINNDIFLNMLNSPVRTLRGRVEVYNGSTLAVMCTCHDVLKSFTVERIGEEGKFFGFGICQKINAHLIDKDRTLSITTANTLEAVFGVDENYIYTFPNFYVTQVNRDENTNELSITAYDALYRASNYTIAELGLPVNYTLKEFATACANKLSLPLKIDAAAADSFNTVYNGGANFDGTESVREGLNALAEATQTIYYINNNWELVFKRLDISGSAIFTIGREKYITLDSSTNKRLGTITHATELGDNVSVSTTAAGSTQYVRNNPFWDLRNDIGTLLDAAIANIGGLTINQFNCNWRGNFLLEIGDKINLTTKDNNIVTSYILNDVISFNGSLSQTTQWKYESNEAETASNPTSLGDALKQTYARVDKANSQIELVASDVSENKENISKLQINTEEINASVSELNAAASSLQLTTEDIAASVQKVETNLNDTIAAANNDILALTSKVEATMTAEDVKLEIQTEIANGVSTVTTSTGFTFNEEGLTVEKTDSEMKTQITEDGMTVYKNEEAVLTANNTGVNAVNLHATTYLIVGTNSRFEDFGERTGCFWIGG